MLRETCPADLHDLDDYPPPSRHRPSALLVIGPAFVVLVGLVLVGALHTWLGSPLGEEWAMEVWSATKSMIFPTIVAASFGVYVSRQQHATPEPQALPTEFYETYRRLPSGHGTGRHRVVQIQAGDEEEENP
ncbi:MAG TPA: hypothetical protein VIK91_03320 [Nannocystis sp.]